MAVRMDNVFAGPSARADKEHFLTLFENRSVKIERIVSHSHSSPPGFWYDQAEDEWVIVLRGHATLEFTSGELVTMKEGDHVLIPSRSKHRIVQTGPETIWLAVHAKKAL
jgi:cupin 2 domain-containing protein